jgi:predicted porin
MKKSLLALAVLGLFAGAASAQSSVTISGKIDQSIGKNLGTKDKSVMDNAGSRIGFSGFEAISADLGAVFAFEHRFWPDTGAGEYADAAPSASAGKFWNGFSLVGIRSASMGTVTLGRQYTSAFLLVQNQIDPFEGEGVGALRNIAIGTGGASATLAGAGGAYAGPAKVRVDNSVKYAHKFGPVSLSADVAEAAGGPDKAISVAANGTFGPVWVGISFEDASDVNDDVLNLGARFNVGPATLSAMYSTGTGTRGVAYDMNAFLLGAKIKVGAGDIKLGYVTRKHEVGTVSTTVHQKAAVGYDHNLSKRTKAYVQFAQESKLTANKSGYEVGVQHKF